jgi:hypothetical protein
MHATIAQLPPSRAATPDQGEAAGHLEALGHVDDAALARPAEHDSVNNPPPLSVAQSDS